MAKVYSWEISKNPTKYAYIVNPNNYKICTICKKPYSTKGRHCCKSDLRCNADR